MNYCRLVLALFLLLFSAETIIVSPPVPRELYEITTDELLTALTEAFKKLPDTSPLKTATPEKSATGESITIKIDDFLFLEAYKRPGSRTVILTTKNNPKLKNHSFYASFTANGLIKTSELFQAEVLKRVNSYNNFMSYLITYYKKYKDTKALMADIQNLIIKNSNGAIKDTDFGGVLIEPLKGKTKSGAEYTFNQATAKVLNEPNFLHITVSHFDTRTLVQIDMPNNQIRALVVPVTENPFAELEKSIQKALDLIKVSTLADVKKVDVAINSAIGKCSYFTKSTDDDLAKFPSFQLLSFRKIVQQVELSPDDVFVRRLRLLSEPKAPSPALVKTANQLPFRRLEGSDCRIHEGVFKINPIIIKTFAYVQLQYVFRGEEYLNEQIIRLTDQKSFDAKVKAFSQDINLQLDRIYGASESKVEIPIADYTVQNFFSTVLQAAAQGGRSKLVCDFTEKQPYVHKKIVKCSKVIRGKKSDVMQVLMYDNPTNKGMKMFEISMIEPGFGTREVQPAQTMTYGLTQAPPTWDIMKEKITQFVNSLPN